VLLPARGCQVPLLAELMEPGRKEQGVSQAEGMRHLPGQRQRRVTPLQGLVRIAQPPQGHGGVGMALHPGVRPVADGMGMVLLVVVEGGPLRKMGLGSGKHAQIVHGVPEGRVGPQEERRVADLLGQGEEVLSQLPRRLQLHLEHIKIP
jgi:hypothetical protein